MATEGGGISLRRAAERFLFTTFFVCATIVRRVVNRAQVHVLRRHNHYKVLQGNLGSLYGRIVVVVARSESIHPSSLERALKSFKEAKFQVFLIVNEPVPKAPSWAGALGADVIVSRPNLGRDFGAYRLAFRLLYSNNPKPHQVVLLNDSVFFLQDPAPLRFLQEHEGPWGCLTWNQHPQPHAQSFALSFRTQVLNSSFFKNYWRRFFPSDLRSVCIRDGEIGLSTILLKARLRPQVYVNLAKFRTIDWDDSSPEESRHVESQIQNLFNYQTRKFSSAFELTVNDFFQNSNVIHSLGLILARQLAVPLKLDIARKGWASIPAIISVLEAAGIDAAETSEIESRLRSEKLFSSMNSLQRFLAERR